MTRLYILTCIAWIVVGVCYAQQPIPPANFDEAKVPKFELTDPLKTTDGRIVNTPELWNEVRRPELLKLFADEMFGHPPLPPTNDLFGNGAQGLRATCYSYNPSFREDNTVAPESNGYFVFNSKGRRYQIFLRLYKQAESGQRMNQDIKILIYVPRNTTGKVPAFLGLNFRGNHTVSADPGIRLGTVWVRPEGGKDGWDGILVPEPAKEEDRGSMARRWPIEMILDRGYAVITAYYGDIEPDFNGGSQFGVRKLLDQKGESNEGNAIATWAWGLELIRDRVVPFTDLNLDPDKIAVIGHSRLGKTALWAAATNPKFAMAISNNSGCGGAALSRREYGETLLLINSVRPHWYCGNFKKYNLDVNSLPFDQHELVALIAPRPVYIASAEEDQWADPKGEFLSGLYADPVYRLLGTDGIGGITEMPPVDKPVGGTIGYHIRTGKHDITEYDWEQFLNFADKHLR